MKTAQKQPEDKRVFVIDAGDGVNKKPLSDAKVASKVCDPHLGFQIC